MIPASSIFFTYVYGSGEIKRRFEMSVKGTRCCRLKCLKFDDRLHLLNFLHFLFNIVQISKKTK